RQSRLGPRLDLGAADHAAVGLAGFKRGPALALQHLHLVAGTCQFVGGHDAGDTGPEDDDLHGFASLPGSLGTGAGCPFNQVGRKISCFVPWAQGNATARPGSTAVRPPKRRSRRWYSATAAARASRSKSG